MCSELQAATVGNALRDEQACLLLLAFQQEDNARTRNEDQDELLSHLAYQEGISHPSLPELDSLHLEKLGRDCLHQLRLARHVLQSHPQAT